MTSQLTPTRPPSLLSPRPSSILLVKPPLRRAEGGRTEEHTVQKTTGREMAGKKRREWVSSSWPTTRASVVYWSPWLQRREVRMGEEWGGGGGGGGGGVHFCRWGDFKSIHEYHECFFPNLLAEKWKMQKERMSVKPDQHQQKFDVY